MIAPDQVFHRVHTTRGNESDHAKIVENVLKSLDSTTQQNISQLLKLEERARRRFSGMEGELLVIDRDCCKELEDPLVKRAKLIQNKCENFWLQVFQNHPVLSKIITAKDAPHLKYLKNVRSTVAQVSNSDSDSDNDEAGDHLEQDSNLQHRYKVTITFEFESNPLFSNSTLSKSVFTTCFSNWLAAPPKFDQTPIDWKGKLKRDSNGAFFDFFKDPWRIVDDGSSTEVYAIVQSHAELCRLLHSHVVPYAPLWYSTNDQTTIDLLDEIQTVIEEVKSKSHDDAQNVLTATQTSVNKILFERYPIVAGETGGATVADFWCLALQECSELNIHISKQEEDILRYLDDITYSSETSHHEASQTLTFRFATNKYFTPNTLCLRLVTTEGAVNVCYPTIKWSEQSEHDTAQTAKKSSKSSSAQTRRVSFFQLLTPPTKRSKSEAVGAKSLLEIFDTFRRILLLNATSLYIEGLVTQFEKIDEGISSGSDQTGSESEGSTESDQLDDAAAPKQPARKGAKHSQAAPQKKHKQQVAKSSGVMLPALSVSIALIALLIALTHTDPITALKSLWARLWM
eukprot:c9626_g1_i1.p1 GENE.c9626_g1_i1~~c9626_g1_i1.p1  ORF type:complete len:586 (+),score=156.06 c9626_g1_i1:46-1758(+)